MAHHLWIANVVPRIRHAHSSVSIGIPVALFSCCSCTVMFYTGEISLLLWLWIQVSTKINFLGAKHLNGLRGLLYNPPECLELPPHLLNSSWIAGFEVLTPMVMKTSNFCDITLWSPLKVIQHFGGTCRFHLQDLLGPRNVIWLSTECTSL
jgi:hypothetical protein